MTTAAVDVLGFLPGPVSKNNAGAADLLAGELFAYAVSSGVAVVDVRIDAYLAPCNGRVSQATLALTLSLACPGAPHATNLCAAWWSQERIHDSCQLVSLPAQWHDSQANQSWLTCKVVHKGLS